MGINYKYYEYDMIFGIIYDIIYDNIYDMYRDSSIRLEEKTEEEIDKLGENKEEDNRDESSLVLATLCA
jgi:hypothetical protein